MYAIKECGGNSKTEIQWRYVHQLTIYIHLRIWLWSDHGDHCNPFLLLQIGRSQVQIVLTEAPRKGGNWQDSDGSNGSSLHHNCCIKIASIWPKHGVSHGIGVSPTIGEIQMNSFWNMVPLPRFLSLLGRAKEQRVVVSEGEFSLGATVSKSRYGLLLLTSKAVAVYQFSRLFVRCFFHFFWDIQNVATWMFFSSFSNPDATIFCKRPDSRRPQTAERGSRPVRGKWQLRNLIGSYGFNMF